MPEGKKTYPRRKWEEQKAIDFAWVRVTGLQMGLTTRDIGFMYVGEFRDMIEEFKKWHNMRIKKQVFAEDDLGKVADPNEVLK